MFMLAVVLLLRGTDFISPANADAAFVGIP